MSTRTYAHVLLVLLAVPLMSCDWLLNYKDDPNYCPGRPHNNCLNDAAGACQADPDCGGGATPVCDVTGTMMCVQCTPEKDDACGGATPACVNNACQACTAHSECSESDVCLPDGTCAGADDVAYVEPAPGGSDNDSCTRGMPCTVIAKALATGRPYVKLRGTTNEQVTVNNRNVTFLAEPGAILTDTSNGILLRIDGTSQVAIYDLEISGASGSANGFGVSIPTGSTTVVSLMRVKVTGNRAGGISASGGSLTISQSTISGNQGGGISASGGELTISQTTISANTGGGLSLMNGTFVVVGNVFFNNGLQTGSVGGVAISTSQNAVNRLEFNSFNKNQTQIGVGAAIQCVAGSFIAHNNIMSENGTLTNMEQVGGTCTHTHSIVRPGTVPMGNSSADPLFENTTTGNLHVRAGSPALGAADPSSELSGIAARDIDGERRTAPADIGADELP